MGTFKLSMKNKKIALGMVFVVFFAGIAIFANCYYRGKANKAGICSQTGTKLSEQELRARVMENYLGFIFDQPQADGESIFRRYTIAVIQRNITRDEVISMIEHSTGKDFLISIGRDENTTRFFSKKDIGKLSKKLFYGDFSVIMYDNSYNVWQKSEGFGTSILSGDTLRINNDGFKNKHGDIRIFANSIHLNPRKGYNPDENLGRYHLILKRVHSFFDIGLFCHDYGNFFFSYDTYGMLNNYDHVYSYSKDDNTRKLKSREWKNRDINFIKKNL